MKQERGQSVAEFALVLPLMMLILLGIVQFGMVFKQYITLTDAVREGSRKAAVARHRADRATHVQGAVVTAGVGSRLRLHDGERRASPRPGTTAKTSSSGPPSRSTSTSSASSCTPGR